MTMKQGRGFSSPINFTDTDTFNEYQQLWYVQPRLHC